MLEVSGVGLDGMLLDVDDTMFEGGAIKHVVAAIRDTVKDFMFDGIQGHIPDTVFRGLISLKRVQQLVQKRELSYAQMRVIYEEMHRCSNLFQNDGFSILKKIIGPARALKLSPLIYNFNLRRGFLFSTDIDRELLVPIYLCVKAGLKVIPASISPLPGRLEMMELNAARKLGLAHGETLFTDLYDSWRVWKTGSMAIKPHPKYFERICSEQGLNPSYTVFVDDQERNLRGARDFGLQVVPIDFAFQGDIFSHPMLRTIVEAAYMKLQDSDDARVQEIRKEFVRIYGLSESLRQQPEFARLFERRFGKVI